MTRYAISFTSATTRAPDTLNVACPNHRSDQYMADVLAGTGATVKGRIDNNQVIDFTLPTEHLKLRTWLKNNSINPKGEVAPITPPPPLVIPTSVVAAAEAEINRQREAAQRNAKAIALLCTFVERWVRPVLRDEAINGADAVDALGDFVQQAAELLGIKPAKVEYICDSCGSTDCGYDATSKWDVEAQEWVLSGTQDSTWCNNCGVDEPTLREVPA